MKFNSLFLALFLICQFVYCQTNTESKNPNIQFKISFIVGPIYPIEFGETALAKAHSANIGLTSSLRLLEYSNFSTGVGLDLINYSVDNKQLIGDYENSKHNSYFIFINYDYEISKKLLLTPNIGYGASELVIRKDGKGRGKQDGKELRMGTSINYNFDKHNALCFTIMYVNNTYDVKANESLQDFFSKSNSIQFGIVYRTQ